MSNIEELTFEERLRRCGEIEDFFEECLRRYGELFSETGCMLLNAVDEATRGSSDVSEILAMIEESRVACLEAIDQPWERPVLTMSEKDAIERIDTNDKKTLKRKNKKNNNEEDDDDDSVNSGTRKKWKLSSSNED